MRRRRDSLAAAACGGGGVSVSGCPPDAPEPAFLRYARPSVVTKARAPSRRGGPDEDAPRPAGPARLARVTAWSCRANACVLTIDGVPLTRWSLRRTRPDGRGRRAPSRPRSPARPSGASAGCGRGPRARPRARPPGAITCPATGAGAGRGCRARVTGAAAGRGRRGRGCRARSRAPSRARSRDPTPRSRPQAPGRAPVAGPDVLQRSAAGAPALQSQERSRIRARRRSPTIDFASAISPRSAMATAARQGMASSSRRSSSSGSSRSWWAGVSSRAR